MMHQGLNWDDCLAHVEATDVGMRRSNNQDSYAVLLASDADNWQRRGHVFLVADGMGAHAAGELASKMAADGIPHSYYKLQDESAGRNPQDDSPGQRRDQPPRPGERRISRHGYDRQRARARAARR